MELWHPSGDSFIGEPDRAAGSETGSFSLPSGSTLFTEREHSVYSVGALCSPSGSTACSLKDPCELLLLVVVIP